MDRERTYALIIRVGAPSYLDYRETRKYPFWRLREAVMFHLQEETRLLQWRQSVAGLKNTAQGYPQDGFNLKATEALELEAMKAAREVGVLLLPWSEWPEVESAKDRAERELYAESGELIEAWIATFEPDNLEQHREARAQKLAQRVQSNARTS